MNVYWILLIVCIVVSSIGWKKFIYFISIGYGFSIAACAVAMVAVWWHTLTWSALVLCEILFIYGCRLGGYLLVRELNSASYRKVLSDNTKDGGYAVGITVVIWVSCALLYVAEVFPVAARFSNMYAGMPVHDIWAWIGAAVMLTGLVVESVADAQKAAAKKKNPHRFVDRGLYKIVRCPNYMGEIIMWTGCMLVCIGACCSWWQWLISIIGYAGIVYIMFSGARRLEIRQNKCYGNDAAYRDYVRKTPILLPLVPIYSVERYSWLRG